MQRSVCVLLVTVLCVLAVAVSAFKHESHSSEHQQFTAWKRQHHKHYDDAQAEAHAFDNFRASIKRVSALNAQQLQRRHAGHASAVFGLNALSDLSPLEFKQQYLNGYTSEGIDSSREVLYEQSSVHSRAAPPAQFDWRTYAAKSVTPVKDQGSCGSCWAFSATEGLESQWYLTNKEQLILSPQQTVDCDSNDHGCSGGDLPTAFDYIEHNGVELESSYPYTSGTSGATGTCSYNASAVKARIVDYKYAVTPCNDTCDDQSKMEPALKIAVAHDNAGVHGPPSICVNAGPWQDYTGGVLTHDQCSGDSSLLDHCVQLVGYTDKYWIARNSWSDTWGLSGYIYLEMGFNTCGVADEVMFPVAKPTTAKHFRHGHH